MAPLLPSSDGPGGRWADYRQVVSWDFLSCVDASVRWRDLPERFGSWKSMYERYRRWSADGTRQQILTGSRIEAGE